jgi:hypothetical protein
VRHSPGHLSTDSHVLESVSSLKRFASQRLLSVYTARN